MLFWLLAANQSIASARGTIIADHNWKISMTHLNLAVMACQNRTNR